MKSKTKFQNTSILFLFFICFLGSCNPKPKTAEEPVKTAKPNILLIVADDLGFSDIAPFGGNIQTPTLDKLSKEGMLFSNFHVLPTCSPTRSAMLSGNDNHIAGIGVMTEFLNPAVKDLPGYQGHFTQQVVTIPEILSENGYHTYMAGKWHLGDEDGQTPFDRGFEESFVLLQGGGSHFADKNPLSPPQVMDYRVNGKKIESLPPDFYSTRNYTDTLISYIDRHKADGKPFFMFAAYTAPHDPLHAPKEYIDKYKGKFDMGWDSLRNLRLENLKALGIVPKDLNSYYPNPSIPKWETLSAEHKAELARDMEVYAAMVDYLDMSIGRLIDYLKKEDMYDKTAIVFMSDNGANGAMATAYPGNADGKYLSGFNNKMENRGLAGSYIEMGPGWAQASSSPFRLFKGFSTEGGIKAPLIFKLPGTMKNAGEWNRGFAHVTDLMPTFLELAGVTFSEDYKGRKVKAPIGKSIVSALNGKAQTAHENDGMGWELFEMKSYIKGNWKILRLPQPFGSGQWQLIDLSKDPAEVNDLSAQFPDKKAELIAEWNAYAKTNEVFDHQGWYDKAYLEKFNVKKK